jgi:hypothetical protein
MRAWVGRRRCGRGRADAAEDEAEELALAQSGGTPEGVGTITGRSDELEVMATSGQRNGATTIGGGDLRVARAVFTLREAATYLGLPNSTLHSWARPGGVAQPIITCFPAHRREATVPFIGFAEA